MHFLTIVIWIIGGLSIWGFMSLHTWYTWMLAGGLLGCAVALVWARRRAYHSVEYWSSAYPKWILILVGPPPIEGSTTFPIPRYYYFSNLPTSLSLIGGIAMTILFAYLSVHRNELYIGFTIIFTLTWTAGIFLFRRYFKRHKFTSIENVNKSPTE